MCIVKKKYVNHAIFSPKLEKKRYRKDFSGFETHEKWLLRGKILAKSEQVYFLGCERVNRKNIFESSPGT